MAETLCRDVLRRELFLCKFLSSNYVTNSSYLVRQARTWKSVIYQERAVMSSSFPNTQLG